MPQNQFLPIAAGDGANALPAAQYISLGILAQGFQSGLVQSPIFNAVLRQLSTVVAALAQFTADNQSLDVLDDGIVANFENKFGAALKGALSASSVHYGIATGTGDAMVVTSTPPMRPAPTGGYQPGSFLVLKTPGVTNQNPNGAAPTINADTIGPIAVSKRDGTIPAKGDIAPTAWTILFFDGQGCFFVDIALSDLVASLPPTSLWHEGVDQSADPTKIVAPVAPAVATRTPKLAYLIFPAHACTGATTIDVGFGPEPLTRNDGVALAAGDYSAVQPLVIVDDGVDFRIVTSVASQLAAAGSGSNGGNSSGSSASVPAGRPITGLLPANIFGSLTTASITVSPGSCVDSSGASSIAAATALNWNVANPNAFQGGGSLPANTTIFMFVIWGSAGTPALFASASLVPTLPAGFTLYRQVFAFYTNGSGPVPFGATEIAGGALYCQLSQPVQDCYNMPITTSQTLFGVSVPVGLNVEWLGTGILIGAPSTALYVTFGSPLDTSLAQPGGSQPYALPNPDAFVSSSGSPGGNELGNKLRITDTSGRLSIRANISYSGLYLTTYGWVLYRRT